MKQQRERMTLWTLGALAGILTFGIWALVLVLHRTPEAAKKPEVAKDALCPPATMSVHERLDCERRGLPSIGPRQEVQQSSSR